MNRTSLLHSMRCLGLGILLFLAGCASQQRGDETAVRAAVNDIWKEYSASLNAGDIDRWLSLWAEDGVQMPPGEPSVVGKKRIRVRNQGFLDRFTFDMSITNEEVGVAGDWAYARGTYAATLSPKQGGDPVLIDGKAIVSIWFLSATSRLRR